MEPLKKTSVANGSVYESCLFANQLSYCLSCQLN